jgi:transcriptional regulator with XRE-family HTH domain
MDCLQDLGAAIAERRKALGYKQKDVAKSAGIRPETLSRLERGQLAEFGVRKMILILAVLKLEVEFVDLRLRGTLDELRIERANSSL